MFDYQSECHCSKTNYPMFSRPAQQSRVLIKKAASEETALNRHPDSHRTLSFERTPSCAISCLAYSPISFEPYPPWLARALTARVAFRQGRIHDGSTPDARAGAPSCGLTTSQNVTAPKPASPSPRERQSLTTSQNVTAPKPGSPISNDSISLTTSQNVTAPKRHKCFRGRHRSLTTSQNVTAPKQGRRGNVDVPGLTTSQNVTAPKPAAAVRLRAHGLTTSQNVTAPKPHRAAQSSRGSLTTSQNVTAPKPLLRSLVRLLPLARRGLGFELMPNPCPSAWRGWRSIAACPGTPSRGRPCGAVRGAS